jgi:hypothetical protein
MVTAKDVRRLALSLPEATERPAWNQPTFRVRDKIFAALSRDGESMGFKVSKEERAELIAGEPGKFFFIDGHDNNYNWARVRFDSVDTEELGELIVEAWRRTAPRQLVKAYDEASR